MKTVHVSIFCFIIFSFLSISAQTGGGEISGEIIDQNGAVVVGASVRLSSEGRNLKTVVTNSSGKFVFGNLQLGEYSLRVETEGFPVQEKSVKIENSRQAKQVSIILVPEIKENVTVDSLQNESLLNTERTAGTLTLSGKEIDALPDDSDALSEQIQQLAAVSGGSPGAAMVSVDGFLTGGRLPPKFAIASIRINPNVFSADYETPPFRAGHIEITTKPGSMEFAGTAFFNFNDDKLNARQSLATMRAETQTRLYGFSLGAPIVKKRSGFFFDFERREINEATTVKAISLEGYFSTNIPTPQRLWNGSARTDWQIGAKRAQFFRFDFNLNKLSNQGTGGLELPERAFNLKRNEQSFRFTDSVALDANSSNELRIGLTIQNYSQLAISDELTILVSGAFSAGGASQRFVERTENRWEINDYFILNKSNHNFKAGTQITFRRVNDKREANPSGVFYFSGLMANNVSLSPLEQYRWTLLGQMRPTRFSITVGSSAVSVNQWRAAFFAQDEWQWRKNVTLSLGFRYETQTAPTDFAGFAPRVGISYSPDQKQNWVFRARGGIFYERISEELTLETLRLNGVRQREFSLDNPFFPNPFLMGGNSLGNNSIPTERVMDSAIRPPSSLQIRFDVERRLRESWYLMATGNWTRGWSNLRSRNVNAPLVSVLNSNPRFAPRPNGMRENILQYESSGRTNGAIFFLGVYQMKDKYFNLFANYTFSDLRTNADSPQMFPQSSYDERGEWVRPAGLSRHRGSIAGIFNLPRNFRAAFILNTSSGVPFNVTSGRDNNGDGIFNDRPALFSTPVADAVQTPFGFLKLDTVNGNLPRNSGTAPANMTVDLSIRRLFVLTKRFDEAKRTLALTVRANNLFNRTNPLNVNGIVSSPLFGRAISTSSARRIEAGVRMTF